MNIWTLLGGLFRKQIPGTPQIRRRSHLRFECLETRAVLSTMVPGMQEVYAGSNHNTSLHADFNGDGFDDLAVGAPSWDVGKALNAGAVNVIYGSKAGLQARGNQLWHQDSPGILGVAESYDRFGTSLTAGDFDGDGFDDLAVGVPGQDWGAQGGAGAVNVIFGSASGLTSVRNKIWNQLDLGSTPMAGDSFGTSLASSDFNADGFDDLAVGAPFRDLNGVPNAGVAYAIRGSATGLRSAGNQVWHQDKLDGSRADSGDNFGTTLVAGDFNGDHVADLAVGVPRDHVGVPDPVYGSSEGGLGTITFLDVTRGSAAGGVNVIYGRRGSGLVSSDSQFWSQDSSGMLDRAESGDSFGQSLAAGDFDGDGNDDLAIGVPGEDLTRFFAFSAVDAGVVNVVYGSRRGLTTDRNQMWSQDSAGIQDGTEGLSLLITSGITSSTSGSSIPGERFGTSLVVGDFNDDGRADLAIGVPGESIGMVREAGAVHVIYGNFFGLNALGSQLWHQESAGIQGTADSGDRFGSAVIAGDFNGDGRSDLAIGVPFKSIGDTRFAGVVNVIYGRRDRLNEAGNQVWHQEIFGVYGWAQWGGLFGA